MRKLMRTIIRRTLLIFIGIVIAFFIYSWIDPQGASKLINAIKGGTGSIQTGVIVNDLSNTGTTSMNDSVIIPSNTGTSSSGSQTNTGTFWGWLRGSSSTGTNSTGTMSGTIMTGVNNTGILVPSNSGSVLISTSSSLPQDFLDAVAAPDTVDNTTDNNAGKADTTSTISNTTDDNTSVSSSSQTITRTVTTTTTSTKTSDGSTVYVFDNQGRSTLTQQDIEDTKQLFSHLIDGASSTSSSSTNTSNNTISSFVLTNYCWNLGSESCTNYRPNIQLRGNGTAPSGVEFTWYDSAYASVQYTNRSDVRIIQISNNTRIAYLPVSSIGSASCSNTSQRNMTSIKISFSANINNQIFQGSNSGYGCGQ